MRTLPQDFAASLAGGATTLARCWKLTRADGVAMGFTDHDRSLSFDGLDFAAGTGLTASDSRAELGLAVGGGEVSGALVAASLTEDDLAAGLYDAAAVEVWLVDWQDPSRRLLLERGTLGDVKRAGSAFTAEVRGSTQAFEEVQGRLFQRACSADFGDRRCGIDASAPRFTLRGTVDATDGATMVRSAGLAAAADGWFTAGRLVFESGANAGRAAEVRAHVAGEGNGDLTLWHAMTRPIVPGDVFLVTAGCDKRFETCSERFANGLNFRGFPHMPGNDYVVRGAQSGEPGMDGGSLFR